jgi:hypothetical protein
MMRNARVEGSEACPLSTMKDLFDIIMKAKVITF